MPALIGSRRALLTPRTGGVVLPTRNLIAGTRTYVGYFTVANYNQTRQPVRTRAAVNNPRLILPAADPYGGIPIDVYASIEYPAGTYTRVKWAGADQGFVSGGSKAISDAIPITIPKNALAWIWVLQHGASGVYMGAPFYAADGAKSEYSASPLADKTMGLGGTISGISIAYSAAALVGPSATSCVGIIGDSIGYGTGENNPAGPTSIPETGFIHRAIGATTPYVDVTISGTAAQGWPTNQTFFDVMAPYCDVFIIEHGTNDIKSGQRTVTQIQSDISAIRAKLPSNAKVWLTTTTPYTSSTDSWATVANQTIAYPTNQGGNSGPTGMLQTLNAWKKSVPTGFAGTIGSASKVQAAGDPDRWAVGMTGEGLHPTPAGHAAMADAALWASFMASLSP